MTAPVRRIGGSRAAGALGQSKWLTPLDVYLECTEGTPGPTNQEEVTADQERGLMLEPALLAWASKRMGLPFVKPAEAIISPRDSFASVSPDGLAGENYLELKAPRTHEGWGDEGTDEIPAEYLLQVVHGLYVTDTKRAYIGALLGGTLKIFKYERDFDLEQFVLEGERRFWEQHVLAGVPPAPVYGDEETLRRRWPRDTKPPLDWHSLNKSQRELLLAWATARGSRLEWTKSEDVLRVSVLDLIGDAAGIAGMPADHPLKRIDAKTNKAAPNSGTWKAVAEELLATLPPDAARALVAKHTPEAGARVLRPWENKPGKSA